MNLVNKFFVNLALLPTSLYKKAGINTAHLRAILEVKLLMDDRRPNSFHETKQKKQDKTITLSTLGTMFMSAFLGAIFLVAFFLTDDPLIQVTFYFSLFIFMLASTLISDFTSVLIDVRDNYIILPKPVNDRTIVFARTLHILIHVCKVIVPMSIPGLIYVANTYGFSSASILVVEIILATLFTIFLINALYLFVLKFTTPQKFKTVISYVQIFVGIAVYSSYQLIPQLLRTSGDTLADQSNNPWLLFIPSFWFAAGWQALLNFDATAVQIIAIVLSILLPIISIYIVIKYLAPTFNRRLAMISGSETSSTHETKHTTHARRRPFINTIAKWVTATPAETTGFLFTWKVTGRSRDFKLKVYPSIGYIIVYMCIIFFKVGAPKNTAPPALLAVYFFSFLLLSALAQMIYSDKHKASWIFYITPVKQPGEIILGAVKSLLVKFYFPAAISAIIVGCFILPPTLLPNLLLALMNVVLIIVSVLYINYRFLPFSTAPTENTGNFIRTVFMLFIMGAIAAIHFLVMQIFWVVIICIALSSIATWLVADAVKRTSWQQLKTSVD